jgi:serine protease
MTGLLSAAILSLSFFGAAPVHVTAGPDGVLGGVMVGESPNDVVIGSYRDGGRVRTVTLRAAGAPAPWRAVTITEEETGRRYPAAIGASAIVRLAPTGEIDSVRQRHDLTAVRELLGSARLFLVDDTSGDGLALASRLALSDDDAIEEVMPDLALERRRTAIPVPPNDPLYGGQWFYEKLHMEDVWATQSGTSDVTIVVVDNGCDTAHPDLVDKLDPGFDALEDDDDPMPPVVNGQMNDHGTACAGLVGASTNNEVGVAGMCPDCRVRCARLLPDDGALVPISDDADVFAWAIDIGAAVISNSWGFNTAVSVPFPLRNAMEAAFDNGRDGKGALVVFAAGNNASIINDDELCNVRGVLCVGAITTFDETTSFSNKGPPVDLVVYTGTYTTDISGPLGSDDSDYTTLFGGTSSACPVAAGAAALLVAERPEMTAQEISDVLIGTVRPAVYAVPDENGHDEEYGYGILDIKAAYTSLLPAGPDGGVDDDDGGEAEPEPDVDDLDGCAGCQGTDASMTGAGALALLVMRRRRARSQSPTDLCR